MKRTAEITHGDKIPRHALYYMETKGYISPIKKRIKRRSYREYRAEDIALARLIWKYHEEMRFEWDAAYEKAVAELKSPSLF